MPVRRSEGAYINEDVNISLQDILNPRKEIRKNVVKGPYASVQQYLKIHFALLREDFVSPLRKAVSRRLTRSQCSSRDGAIFHEGVVFLREVVINAGHCYTVKFAERFTVNETSRRFLCGSLLVFTKDNFTTVVFGKVVRYEESDLRKGEIVVELRDNLFLHDTLKKTKFLMVEPTPFFEPYFQVMTALKTIQYEKFPMEEYIVKCNSEVGCPKYLQFNRCKYNIEGYPRSFDPLLDWPEGAKFYDLNPSQTTALKAALTKRFVIIQGPPGTGKTHLGHKMVETLLRNHHAWYASSPMLVVCTTNHALDQFLEGLVPITERIVRIGSRSKSKMLEKYLFGEKRRKSKINAGEIGASWGEVNTAEKQMENILKYLEDIEECQGIVCFGIFKDTIPEFSYTGLTPASNSNVLDWMCKEIMRHDDITGISEEFGQMSVKNKEEKKKKPDVVIKYAYRKPVVTIRELYQKYRAMKIVHDTTVSKVKRESTAYELKKLARLHDFLMNKLKEVKNALTASDSDSLSLLRLSDHWSLYIDLLKYTRSMLQSELRRLKSEFPKLYDSAVNRRKYVDIAVMKDALVIGMTTTAAARLRPLLNEVKCPIVIAEEAAEALESHIVASLTSHCQHLILIGNHKQLQPKTADHDLEVKYKLGISLFERMVNNGIQCHTLNTQHRMRPEISSLIVPAIYPTLKDHLSVLNRRVPPGLERPVFFFHHNHPEQSVQSSKSNKFEALFVTYLARQLIWHGNNPEDMVILVAYSGQFELVRRHCNGIKDLVKVRISTLDGFQGEESKVVLLSLVRSRSPGFLAVENRVCVALSRARDGLYIFGNMEMLCQNSQTYQNPTLADWVYR